MESSDQLDIEAPELKRKKKTPKKLKDFSGWENEEEKFDESPKEHYKKNFDQAFELILEGFKQRFEQKNLQHYENLQELLMLAAKKEDYGERLDRVLAHYKEDLNESSLRAQMTMFQKMFPDNDTLCYTDVIDFFKKLEPGKRKLLSEVCKVFELILVLPASNAEVERSFSKLKIIKTRLRSRMKSKKLNYFMIFKQYKDRVDKLDLETIANDFINNKSCEKRQRVFGKNKVAKHEKLLKIAKQMKK